MQYRLYTMLVGTKSCISLILLGKAVASLYCEAEEVGPNWD